MAKSNGGTRNSTPNTPASKPQTFEEQVDSALVTLKKEFFDRMDDYYTDSAERWKEGFEDWRKKDEYILGAGPSAHRQQERAAEFYDTKYNQTSPLSQHSKRGDILRSTYSELVAGGYYKEGAKAPNFYDLARGRSSVSEMDKAVRATAERISEKSFADVRSKMIKSTVEKGIDLKNATVRKASNEGFLISDGKVTLHARHVMAWGEIKRPHMRFIITDRKS